ncbi:hypothetical protein DTO212C5_6489 [Paecilomyces variotii]|nr:hypothetical protein DTO212C5_6489 [Paecilomyces variotii]
MASNGVAKESKEARSLFERIEFPSIPKEAGRKIAQLEQEFIRAEVEQLRRSVPLLQPIYEKRNALINTPELQDADFWPRVFSNAPGEIDHYILPSDAAIIGETLKNLTVERFEVDKNGNGEPRSVRLTFEFQTGEANRFFDNAKLVKDFYWRKEVTKTAKGKRRTWEGLVSEPVRINWKEGMDPTKGLLDAAVDLAEAEKKHGGDRKKLPEYEKLVKKVAEVEADALTGGEDEEADDEDIGATSPAGVSFFAFFGYRGKDVSAEKSKEAEKEEEERWAKIAKGEKVEDDEEDEDDEDDDEIEEEDDLEDAEIFPDGEDLAVAIAEDLWPGALKYYVQSYELAEDLDSDFDIDDVDDDEFDEEDADKEDEEERPRKKARN